MNVIDKHNQRIASAIADAAKISRLTADWTTEIVHIDDFIHRNLKPIRARCRDAYVNNSLIKRYVGILQRNVIGNTGIQLQMRIVDPNGKTDALANEAVEKAFKTWAKRKYCEITGRYSWLSVQLAWIHSLAIDGEFLARKIRGDSEFGFQWQVLDPELLDLNHNERLKNGNYIRFSIEFTDYGKPVAYYLLNRDPFSSANHVFNGMKYDRIDANDIFHDFIPLFVGQKRGLPMPHAALYDLHQLKGYDNAALVSARVGAIQGGFFTRPADLDDETPVYENGQPKVDENGHPIIERDEGGIVPVDIEPAELVELPRGVEFTPFNPDYPHSQYAQFTKSHQQRGASGLDNVSYHTLSNDLEGVSFSSIRTGTLEDREAWKLLQSHAKEGICEETFSEWLPYALLSGKILINDKPVPFTRLNKFNQSSWQPRRWDWVDPLKDAKAYELAEKQRWVSKSGVIRARGGDPEETAKEIEQDKDRFPEPVAETPEPPTNDNEANNAKVNNETD